MNRDVCVFGGFERGLFRGGGRISHGGTEARREAEVRSTRRLATEKVIKISGHGESAPPKSGF